jgi:hypothetical protein
MQRIHREISSSLCPNLNNYPEPTQSRTIFSCPSSGITFLSLLSIGHNTKTTKNFSLSFAFTSGYKKRRKHKKIKNIFVMLVLNLQQSYHLSFYSFTEYNNHTCFLLEMNGFYDTPPGFFAARHIATSSSRNASSLPSKLQDLSPSSTPPSSYERTTRSGLISFESPTAQ